MGVATSDIVNILTFPDVSVGDEVEFVSVTRKSGVLKHGTTHISYKCNAYLELTNGEIVDGALFNDGHINNIIVGNKMYPIPIPEGTLKRVLARIQSGGHRLQEPYQRVCRIMGEPSGLALVEDDGRFVYQRTHHTIANSDRRRGKSRTKSIGMNLPQYRDKVRTRFVDSWKQIIYNECESRKNTPER